MCIHSAKVALNRLIETSKHRPLSESEMKRFYSLRVLLVANNEHPLTKDIEVNSYESFCIS